MIKKQIFDVGDGLIELIENQRNTKISRILISYEMNADTHEKNGKEEQWSPEIFHFSDITWSSMKSPPSPPFSLVLGGEAEWERDLERSRDLERDFVFLE